MDYDIDLAAAMESHPDVLSCTINDEGRATLRFRPGAAMSANALLAYLDRRLGVEHPITRITIDA